MPDQKPNFYELYRLVGGIDKKLDQAIKQIDDHHFRINNIEKIQDQIVGKMSIIGIICGFVGAIIISVIGYFIKK